MKKFIIHAGGSGRLGNQLLLAAHLNAWQRVHDKKRVLRIYQVGLGDYQFVFKKKIFSGPRIGLANWSAEKSGVNSLRYYYEKALQLSGALLGQVMTAPVDLDHLNPEDLPRFTVFSGHEFRAWESVAQCQSEVIQDLCFRDQIAQKAKEIFLGFSRKQQRVVSVFCRRGDYEFWCNGKYFFPVSQYVAWIKNLQELGWAVFLVTHDKRMIDFCHAHFQDTVPVVRSDQAALDMAVMGLADLIVSPPSTFSAWAALFGQKPIFCLRQLGQTLDDFDQKWIQPSFKDLRQDKDLGRAFR